MWLNIPGNDVHTAVQEGLIKVDEYELDDARLCYHGLPPTLPYPWIRTRYGYIP
ncbi:hypothetical protein KI387_002508, partial [Taxus chinensis]